MASSARSSLSAARSIPLGLLLSLLSGPLVAGQPIFVDGFESGDTSAWVPCDPDGTYLLTSPPEISYYCCFGIVDLTITQFLLSLDGSTINSAPSNPVTMVGAGASCPSGSFTANQQEPGGCTIGYSVGGNFASDDTWQGSFQLTFTGQDCDCFGGLDTPCVDQTFPIETSR